MTLRKGLLLGFAAAMLLCLPARGVAQTSTTGAVAGVVRDTTGAVLPGVTVEAASPALIEKVRTGITDAQGNYKIIDLRPGTYAVTFTLPGFATFKRDGLELSGGFTATVNADMRVGALEETVTVTGATPIVDVQNARTQQVLKSEVMDALPSGSKNVMQFAAVTLGALPSSPGRNDVGGDKAEQSSGIIVHGGRGDDGKVNWDGMNINSFHGAGGGQMRVYYPNMVAAQEVVIDTGGNVAESETGGANQNIVPREGGNTFSLYGTTNWTNGRFSSKAISDEVAARGASPQSSVKVIYDHGVGVGGPIRQDKVWFYGTTRWWGAQNPGINNYFNKSTNPFTYVPDTSRPAYTDSYYRDSSFRITWQASRKDKVNAEFHVQHGCSCWLGIGPGALTSPEASSDFLYGPQRLTQATWSRTATNRLLLQASANFMYQTVGMSAGAAENKNWFTLISTAPPTPTTISIIDLTSGYRWGGLAGGGTQYGLKNPSNNLNQRFVLSYVTGSHAFKTGIQLLQGKHNTFGPQADDPGLAARSIDYTFRSGVPVGLNEYATPVLNDVRLTSEGLFAQDQWTLKKLTLNMGVRFDHFEGHAPAYTVPAGPYVGARSFPELTNVPNYKDITPRIGGAYDVFGNGKTAIKASWGRYLFGQGSALSLTVAPAAAIVQSANRTWNDANGNFVPDCTLTSPAANGECGAISNSLFGQAVPNIRLADDVRQGWGVREYNYQTSVGVQQELVPGVGVTVAYFHTAWGNQTVIQNTAVTPADFTEFCITAPTDTRLGDVSGSRVCGLYDVNPNKFGQVNRVVTLAKNFGNPGELYSGVDMSMNARWGRGALVQGGFSLGRQTVDFCYANGHPELTPQSFPTTAGALPRADSHCHIVSSWWNGIGTQIKAQAVYPLPLDFQLSGTFKHIAGIPRTATLVLGNAQIAPALGRNLSACPAAGTCTATVSLSLLPAASPANSGSPTAVEYDMRLTQVDMRVTKIVRLAGKRRVQGILDVYNIFNIRPVQGINPTFGAAWLRPTSLLSGRLLKFGAQVDF